MFQQFKQFGQLGVVGFFLQGEKPVVYAHGQISRESADLMDLQTSIQVMNEAIKNSNYLLYKDKIENQLLGFTAYQTFN